MHGSIMNWLRGHADRMPGHFKDGARVLELGSRNINGSPRDVFGERGIDPAYYLGVDANGGAGVDVAGVAHEVVPEHAIKKMGCFDIVISTEMLEHDPYWEQTLQLCARALRPGGVLLLSCASSRRKPHNLDDSPVPGHYRGLDPDDLVPVLEATGPWLSLRGARDRNDLDTLIEGVRGYPEAP